VAIAAGVVLDASSALEAVGRGRGGRGDDDDDDDDDGGGGSGGKTTC